MLSNNTEEKIIKFFLGISNGDSEIDKIKQNLINNYPINPVQIFNRIDRDCKGGISQNDLISFLNYYNIPCSNLESEFFFYFYDLNMDGLIDFIEFLNIIISDTNYLFKKAWKKKFVKGNLSSEDINNVLNPEVEKQILFLLDKECEFCRYVYELINDIKNSNDFNFEEMFYVIKSYSYVTNESIKAFFDRNQISYSENDIKSIINRIENNQDSKICFKRLKMLFDLPDHIDLNKNSYSNNSNILLMSGNSNINKTPYMNPNYNLYNDSNNNVQSNINYYSDNNTANKKIKNNFNIPNLNLNNNINENNYNGNYNIDENNNNYGNMFIPNKEFKLTDDYNENEMQYICAHCSKGGSPVLRKRNINKKVPILSPRINHRNIGYKEFVYENRENSLNKSYEKSLSRSSSVEPKEGINQRENICNEIYDYYNKNNYNNNNIHKINVNDFEENKNYNNFIYQKNKFSKILNRNYSKDNINVNNDKFKNRTLNKNSNFSGIDLSRKRTECKRMKNENFPYKNTNYNFNYS